MKGRPGRRFCTLKIGLARRVSWMRDKMLQECCLGIVTGLADLDTTLLVEEMENGTWRTSPLFHELCVR